MGKNSGTTLKRVSYNPTAQERELQSYIQNSLLNNVPNLNVFSDDVRKQLDNQMNAYTNQGLNFINQTYTPMFSDLKNDIARRFGNFDNAVFMDNLNGIESQRANSMSAFAQDILAKQSQLYNEELARRYNYINLISGLQNTYDNKALSYLGLAPIQSSGGFDGGAIMQGLVNSTANQVTPYIGKMIDAILKR